MDQGVRNLNPRTCSMHGDKKVGAFAIGAGDQCKCPLWLSTRAFRKSIAPEGLVKCDSYLRDSGWMIEQGPSFKRGGIATSNMYTKFLIRLKDR